MLLDIGKIKVTDRIRKDFGNIQELAEDIRENGLINPPVVTPENELIAGERRLRACKSLGYQQIEVRVMSVKDSEHQLQIEISENENRKDFTFSERVDWAKRLERVESIKAKERMGQGTQNSAGLETRQVVADKSGFGSHDTLSKAKFIADNASEEIIKQLNDEKISINKAYQQTKANLQEAETKAKEAERKAKKAEEQVGDLISEVQRLNMQLTKQPQIIEKPVIPPEVQQQLSEAENLIREKDKLQSENRLLKLNLEEAHGKANQEPQIVEVIPEDYHRLKTKVEEQQTELHHLTRAQLTMKDKQKVKTDATLLVQELVKNTERLKFDYGQVGELDQDTDQHIESAAKVCDRMAQELRSLIYTMEVKAIG
jgi:ParB family chromosome partitioning protein